MVKWGAVERLVSTAIHQIERETAIAAGTAPTYSDLTNRRAFRDFKARKGHLRKLFERHANKVELARLDAIYKTLIEPGKVRHALGHEVTAIQYMTGDLAIIKHANPASGEPALTTWKTFEELVATVRALDIGHHAMATLIIEISLRIGSARTD